MERRDSEQNEAYETPQLVEVGGFADLTLGSGHQHSESYGYYD
ncbi:MULTISPECIES: albusnodin family lasso peptide [Streptomyces]|uniref:Albusnodin family lasso peptide n=1 Tax=Streptomyces morookaense TaxID=1970 RepID=A0A7Y7E949_STRMO|nr:MULTISPECIES: albusnodin family lasso peptide [Streptomyces]MCC2280767.1 albusnodin family lasso peptide [Streptomyces sp. ET3-23]NVK80041.1 albusnodin family lasso peptide [Streptomyces morookaense]GHF41761.1 hypothetical protein GCM10010359_50550 [Streptomyces morookaense]